MKTLIIAIIIFLTWGVAEAKILQVPGFSGVCVDSETGDFVDCSPEDPCIDCDCRVCEEEEKPCVWEVKWVYRKDMKELEAELNKWLNEGWNFIAPESCEPYWDLFADKGVWLRRCRR